MTSSAQTPAERIAARGRRLRRLGAIGAIATLATFSGLAAARVDSGGSTAAASVSAPSVAAQDDPYLSDDGSGGAVVSPATPSATPDATSGAS